MTATIHDFAAPYWEWIASEAALVGTDGCSAVMGFKVECCFEHDLGYRYARDPRDAYRLYRAGNELHCWDIAATIDRGEVDGRFRQCLQNQSKLGRWSPMALWRWLGVRIGGQKAWDAHRRREQDEVIGA